MPRSLLDYKDKNLTLKPLMLVEEAALKAEQERQARQQEERDALATEEEDSNAAPIGSGTFGRSYREFEGIKPLSNEASSLYNALISESQVTDSPLANVIENRRKSKSLTSKNAMLLERLKNSMMLLIEL